MMIMVQLLGKYMIIGYLDPKGYLTTIQIIVCGIGHNCLSMWTRGPVGLLRYYLERSCKQCSVFRDK